LLGLGLATAYKLPQIKYGQLNRKYKNYALGMGTVGLGAIAVGQKWKQ